MRILTHLHQSDVLANGADDPLYVKWFGTGDYISVVGAYEGLLSSNKRNVTIRCDNPDQKYVLKRVILPFRSGI